MLYIIQLTNKLQDKKVAQRSTNDNISLLRNLIERAQETGENLLDRYLRAAFHKIEREVIWKTLETLGTHNKIIKLSKRIYRNVKAVVQINGQRSEIFDLMNKLNRGIA